VNDTDFDAFAEAWSAAYESCSRGKVPSPGAMNLAFDALSIYSLNQITAALTRHIRSTESKFGLTPADVVRQIDGETPTADQIIGAAQKPRTALAAFCRAEIGSWNLDNWTAYQLKPMAEHCISMIPEWRQRIARGELTDHERGLLEKYEVDMQSTRLAGPRLAIGHSE